MNFYNYKDDRTEREKHLERELEDEREALENERRRNQQELESRRQEQRARWAEAEREADTWPEAFEKQARLCWHEHNSFPEQTAEITGDPLDDYFKVMAQANELALVIWRKVEASKQEKLKELQRQIEAVQDEIRNETANQLEAVSDRMEYKNTADSIREDNLFQYLNW